MKTKNKWLSLTLNGKKLEVTNNASVEKISLDWPAATISINGKKIKASTPLDKASKEKNRIFQEFEDSGIRFKVSATLGKGPWFTKKVEVSTPKELPTPDYIEVDSQELESDGLERCGYMATKSLDLTKGEEEGGGHMPGCGYPLIGKKFFIGLEHPAGFNCVEKKKNKELVSLKHYPVWEDRKLQEVDEVFGWSENAFEAFGDYLEQIRLPMLKKPFVSFCTFWTDPYIGNCEYNVTFEAYKAFFEAFGKLKLRPDAFTLDAGWNDRQSIFQAKKEVGRDKGLVKLRKLAEKMGSSLSLWNSHNGPMGIAPEYLKKNGMEVGGGQSSTYCGEGYGVMMDPKFSKALEERFLEIIKKVGAVHFKIDWDNECATNPKFAKKYPGCNHVRQASINEFFRIASKLRKVDLEIITRNGWWPSPWWLCEASHVWLSDSGDSEYASVPSKTQRDSAQTHRDIMYYNILQRDKTPVPLDCFDNHEFPDALRNPFSAEKSSWTNAVWLSFMRGSTYIAYTLMPESLEDWQIESVREIMKFCRTYKKNIFVERGKMVLGNPSQGEVYGYLQNGKDESWCVLRNPLPIPQKIKFKPSELTSHKTISNLQFYPHYETFDPEKGILFLPHELKIIIFSSKNEKWPESKPHMINSKGLFTAASEDPMLDKIHHLNGLKYNDFKKSKLNDGVQLRWLMEVPCRMRNAEIIFSIENNKDNIIPEASSARYADGHSSYSIPVAQILQSEMGHGERKNSLEDSSNWPQYYSFTLPDGGHSCITLKLKGASGKEKITAWACGYEAPARKGKTPQKTGRKFTKCLPFQHPLGFGKAIELPR
jgi:hypothetical protein